jgi:hypothetical protein
MALELAFGFVNLTKKPEKRLWHLIYENQHFAKWLWEPFFAFFREVVCLQNGSQSLSS